MPSQQRDHMHAFGMGPMPTIEELQMKLGTLYEFREPLAVCDPSRDWDVVYYSYRHIPDKEGLIKTLQITNGFMRDKKRSLLDEIAYQIWKANRPRRVPCQHSGLL